MRSVSNLIFFTVPETDPLRRFLTAAAKQNRENAASALAEIFRLGAAEGLRGNLFQGWLTRTLLLSENSYTLASERSRFVPESLKKMALWDLEAFFEWFSLDPAQCADLPAFLLEAASDFSPSERLGSPLAREEVAALTAELAAAKSAEEFQEILEAFFASFGAGKFALYSSFRLGEDGSLLPVCRETGADLDELVGYEAQKEKLLENTEAFLAGRRANNCLLYGEAGTGKSTSVRAVVNRYFGRGLRMIEVYKHQIRLLPKVLSRLGERNYRFILFMDDLSFEEFEVEYKYLKAVIEGGLEEKPENVLVYATSNRRHLLRENIRDNAETEDLHPGDTKEEKLSLSDRFGLTLYFGSPDKKQFEEIVLTLARRHGIRKSPEELIAEAHRFELRHKGLSGRAARQFIDQILAAGE